MNFFPLWIPAFLCLATPVWAQGSKDGITPAMSPTKPDLPSGPLLHQADDFSQWQVAFTYPEDQKKEKAASPKVPSAAADARPRKTATTKTGKIIHEQTTDDLNRITDVWFNGGTQYTKNGKDPIWYQADPGLMGSQSYKPLPANGFRALDWITESNYAGTVPYMGGRQCLVFTPGGYQKLDLSVPAQRDQRMAAASVIAYVDAETRLPIAVRTRSETSLYHFDPPPTQMQTLPSDLAEQVKKGEEARARLLHPAPRPY